MLKHEHFQELCAAASVGQASADELLELERHASYCDECRRLYAEYLALAARRFAGIQNEPALSLEEAKECLHSPLFEQRFFDLARREGIIFSAEADRDIRQIQPTTVTSAQRRPWRLAAAAVAAVVLIGIGLSGANHYTNKASRHRRAASQAHTPVPTDYYLAQLNRRIAELTAHNVGLTAKIRLVEAQMGQISAQSDSKDASLRRAANRNFKLALDRDALEAQLRGLQQQLLDSQTRAAAAQQDVAKLRSETDEATASLVAAQMKISDLSAELKSTSAALDQDRQLLALGHDVSDLMGARNLHIVDVVDTDPHGRNRPAFGRIFFTEGKSLVFYAYDLNEARIEKAGYQYRVWAKREGGDHKVRSLGIFYSDDKSQRRWVYKCDDPKILSEIDSVFVTFEPAKADRIHPKGPNLMYAYLRGQPNHP